MVNILKNLRPFLNYNFKVQWEIHFLLFKYCRNSSKIYFEQIYGYSHFKSALRINFGLREEVKLKTHKYAYFRIFCDPNLYRSYYLHRSRQLVSPVCGIFFFFLFFTKPLKIVQTVCQGPTDKPSSVIFFVNLPKIIQLPKL